MGALTAVAGWALASSHIVEASRLLAWHGWIGAAAAVGAIGAAVLSTAAGERTRRRLLAYRAALFVAAALVAIAGHLGGTLVWGADFLRP